MKGTDIPYSFPITKRVGSRLRLLAIENNNANVIAGIGSNIIILGKLNHFLKISGLTPGVKIDIAIMLANMNHKLVRAHVTAFNCNSRSDFIISQLAPNNLYANVKHTPMRALKTKSDQVS